MRISDRMLTDNVRSNLQLNVQNLSTLQQELATNKRINLPSDDPAGTAQAMRYSTDLASSEQYLRTAQGAQGKLNTADAALGSLNEIVQRARELAVKAGGGTLSGTDEQSIAAEINQLANQAIQIGNSNVGGQYLFGGSQTTTPPFTAVGGSSPSSVTYSGDSAPIVLGLGGGASVRVDVAGNGVFSPVIATLISLRDGLTGPSPQSAASAAIGQLDSGLDTLLATRGTVGARVNGITTLIGTLGDTNINLTSLQSNLVDADITDVIVRLNAAQNVYQAALGAAAKVIVPSLAEFLH